jgi:hypothetical protein
MNALENKQALLRCIELFNKCTLEWVDICYSQKLEWIELPKSTTPKGRQGDFIFFHASAEQALQLFPNRKLTVLKIVADDNCVVMDQEWQGTLAVSAGEYVAGTIFRLRLASFFTLENGLIIKQVDYCISMV